MFAKKAKPYRNSIYTYTLQHLPEKLEVAPDTAISWTMRNASSCQTIFWKTLWNKILLSKI